MVEVRVEAAEDACAVRLMNFIAGTNQLLFEGLMRVLPVIGCVYGVWMVGVIDEIRMPVTDTFRNPIFVNTKTRVRATLPSGPQTRIGRFQLLCYKYLWGNLVKDNFNARSFLSFFGLNPPYTLSEEIQQHSSILAQIFLQRPSRTYSMLPLAHEQLLLRYDSKEINRCWVKTVSHMIMLGSLVRSNTVSSSGWENEKPTLFLVGNADLVS